MKWKAGKYKGVRLTFELILLKDIGIQGLTRRVCDSYAIMNLRHS